MCSCLFFFPYSKAKRFVFLDLIPKCFLETYCFSQKKFLQRNVYAKQMEHKKLNLSKYLKILHIWLYKTLLSFKTKLIIFAFLITFYTDITVYHCKIHLWVWGLTFLHPEIGMLLTISVSLEASP